MMKMVIDNLDVEMMSTVEILNLIGSRTTKLGTQIENELTSEFWRRYPFHIFMELARNQEGTQRDIKELKEVIAGLTQLLIDKGVLPANP